MSVYYVESKNFHENKFSKSNMLLVE